MKTTTFTLGEVGDLGAPPGSKPWAIAVRLKLQSLLKDKKSSEHHIGVYLKGMARQKGYEQLTDDRGHPFQDLDEFIEAKYPYGLGQTEQIQRCVDIDRLIQWLTGLKDQAEDEFEEAHQRREYVDKHPEQDEYDAEKEWTSIDVRIRQYGAQVQMLNSVIEKIQTMVDEDETEPSPDDDMYMPF